MLRYTDYDIVFQEIPDEVTLAVNLSCCPNRCPGCHSPQLQSAIGEPLTNQIVDMLLALYDRSVTCLCLMGGDNDPYEIAQLTSRVRILHPTLHTAWYSGRENLPAAFPSGALDYVKLGSYVESLGALNSPTTNQRLYRLHGDGSRSDLTYRFHRHATTK